MSSARILTTIFLTAALLLLAGCERDPKKREAKYMSDGKAQLAKKDYKSAILSFRNAAQQDPKDSEPQYQLGLAYMQSGNIRGALEAFAEANHLNPSDTGSQLKLAELLSLSGREDLVQAARNRLEALRKTKPNDPEVATSLAEAEMLLGESEEADHLLEETLQKFPTELQATIRLAWLRLKQKDVSGAEALFQQAVAAAPRSSDAFTALGRFYVLIRELDKAEPQFRRALELDPANPRAMLSLGAIQIAGNRLTEADATYQRLASLGIARYKPIHAVFLYQTGKREAAVAEFEKLAKADPSDRDARLRLFSADIALGRYAQAEAVVNDALKKNPNDTGALLLRSEWELQRRQPAKAKDDLQQVLRFKPDSAVAHFRLARAAAMQGMASSQEQELNEALRVDPKFLPARLALAEKYEAENHPNLALRVIDEAPAGQAKTPALLVERNWALFALGKYQDLKQSIAEFPPSASSPDVLLQTALVKLVQGDNAGARASAEEILAKDPENTRAAYAIVQSYFEEKRLPVGLKRLEELAAASPKSPDMQHVLGLWRVRAGDLDGAAKAFEAAKAADPKFLPSLVAFAEVDVRRDRLDSAQHRLDEILKVDPKNIPALMLMAGIEERRNNMDAAVARYRTILSVDNANLVAMNNLASDLAVDHPDEALVHAEKAAQIAPKNPMVQDTLGHVYYSKGLYSRALDYLKSANALHPSPQFEFHIGMCYAKLGDRETGRTMVRQALAKDPNLIKTEVGW
jgi:tetratricopeptide (TPR) repeat protein